MTAGATLLALVRGLGGLLAVLALAWLLARLARRTLGPVGHGPALVDRLALGRDASVAVVRVADAHLVLGVTAHQVTVLHRLDPEVAAGHYPPAPPAERVVLDLDAAGRPAAPSPGPGGSVLDPRTWSRMLDAVRERTVRRR